MTKTGKTDTGNSDKNGKSDKSDLPFDTDTFAPYPMAPTVYYPELEAQIKTYLSDAEVARVYDAYLYAAEKHEGQFRKSGDPYITHPIAVAQICSLWKLDTETLIVALLHDVVEDQGVSLSEISGRFGNEVASMVDGLSKIERATAKNTPEAQGENFRKILLSMSRDFRVILVKLADRLHNMRTLGVMRFEKRRRIAQETMDVFVPIALRLGLNVLYREIQDLSFANLHPYRYAIISKALKSSRDKRYEELQKVHAAIGAALEARRIRARILPREKTLYGIFKKMKETQSPFKDIRDIYGFNVIVNDVDTCYVTLGVLHALYKPIPGHVQDHIAMPKINRYQSIHTSVIGPTGEQVNLQIRTRQMHQVAEAGVASHWLYKTETESMGELVKRSLGWLESLMEIQGQDANSAEFIEHIKYDLFPGDIYVVTPRGQTIPLPKSATALDFAYAIHSDVGEHTAGVKVNDMQVPLRTELKNGDIVEIITSDDAHPTPLWLEYVRTGKARSRIRSYLRSVSVAESVMVGKRLLERELERMPLALEAIPQNVFERMLYEIGAKSADELFADIGTGKRLAVFVSRHLVSLMDANLTEDQPGEIQPKPVLIFGAEGLPVTLADCCKPIPGDPIIGEMRTKNGMVVHTADCESAKRLLKRDPDRMIPVGWSETTTETFDCTLNLIAIDAKGLLARVTGEISGADANIASVSMSTEGDFTRFHFIVQVRDRVHYAQLLKRVRHINGVQKVSRDPL